MVVEKGASSHISHCILAHLLELRVRLTQGVVLRLLDLVAVDGHNDLIYNLLVGATIAELVAKNKCQKYDRDNDREHDTVLCTKCV